MAEPLEINADTAVVHTMRMRVVDAARIVARQPDDRGPLEALEEALADYDAALAWYGVGQGEVE